jgi:hypothetical protein
MVAKCQQATGKKTPSSIGLKSQLDWQIHPFEYQGRSWNYIVIVIWFNNAGALAH